MWLFYDFVIVFYLVVVAIFLFEMIRRKEKKHVVRFVSCVLFVGWLAIGYGSFVEPQRLVTTKTDVFFSDDPKTTLRAAVVADFHVGPYKKTKWVQRVVDRVLAMKPDIIFLPGDFVFDSKSQVQFLKPLCQLSAPLGVFAVTGNHDHHAKAQGQVRALLGGCGIRVLDNESISLKAGNHSFILSGVSDIWFEGNTHQTLENVDEEDDVVLLAHNPETILLANANRADLIISGHTHGGQIRLPFIGALSSIPTQLGRAFDRGLFFFDKTQVFITSGVGETGVRARLFNPPEVSELLVHW